MSTLDANSFKVTLVFVALKKILNLALIMYSVGMEVVMV